MPSKAGKSRQGSGQTGWPHGGHVETAAALLSSEVVAVVAVAMLM